MAIKFQKLNAMQIKRESSNKILRVIFLLVMVLGLNGGAGVFVDNIFANVTLGFREIMMRSVFKISNGKIPIGTVFIMAQPIPNTPAKGQYVLMTAKHVLEVIKTDRAILLLREKQGETFGRLKYLIQIREGGNPIWTNHPDVDIAAMRICLPKSADVSSISTNFLATDEMLKKYEASPGDEVMALGFPLGRESNKAGFPILRSGIIANFPLTPVSKYKTFTMDYEVFRGDSGGPVIYYTENPFYGGTTHFKKVHFIMGIQSGMMIKMDSTKMPDGIITKERKLGLAIVVHAHFMKDLLGMLPPISIESKCKGSRVITPTKSKNHIQLNEGDF